ncbi:hypothetical protein LLG95_12555 [bacterium]|nr:hypothetical protein [bacterium]
MILISRGVESCSAGCGRGGDARRGPEKLGAALFDPADAFEAPDDLTQKRKTAKNQ